MAIRENRIQMQGVDDAESVVGGGSDLLYVMRNVGIAWTESAALRTVVQLQVPHILATQAAPPHHAMSAQQLLQHMAGASNPDAGALERLLRLLTCRGLFAEHLEQRPQPSGMDGSDHVHAVRMFALTPMSRALVPGHPRGNMINFVLTTTLAPHYAATLEHLSEAILTSTDPFTLAFGINQYDWMRKHPEVLAVFQQAMNDQASDKGPLLVKRYSGFNTVRSIIDVGGGSGATLSQIMRHYPHINHAINFDLPEVVALAPPSPGIEHVGGDMFQSIPTGCDTIIMKMVLHNWDDDACIKALKKCHEALPETGGKLILVEALLPHETPRSCEKLTAVEEFVFKLSVLMFVDCAGGKERSEHDFRHLVTIAGFRNFQVVVKLDAVGYVMEAFK